MSSLILLNDNDSAIALSNNCFLSASSLILAFALALVYSISPRLDVLASVNEGDSLYC